MREYVVGYYNNSKDAFTILATMDSKLVGMFVRDSYNGCYERNGMSTRLVLLHRNEVPDKYKFSEGL